jgi:hypothetical protein
VHQVPVPSNPVSVAEERDLVAGVEEQVRALSPPVARWKVEWRRDVDDETAAEDAEQRLYVDFYIEGDARQAVDAMHQLHRRIRAAVGATADRVVLNPCVA